MAREWTVEAGEHATFIVRVTRGERGGLSALVERVRTGEKARVQRVERLGRVLLRMLESPADGAAYPENPAETSSPGPNPGN